MAFTDSSPAAYEGSNGVSEAAVQSPAPAKSKAPGVIADKSPAPPSLNERARRKLKASGITDAVRKSLNIEVWTAAEALKAGFKQGRGGMWIPYPTTEGRFLKPSFGRFRFLDPAVGFAASYKDDLRYMQLPGSLNGIYCPSGFIGKGVTWTEYLADASLPLIVTEGELKAICACLHGFPTIGLGGVNMWSARQRGIDWLAVLEETKFDNREVWIAFDSDAAVKEGVIKAQASFARELTNRGARVRIVSLPPTAKGEKQGLDDFLIAHGKETFQTLLDQAEDFGPAVALWTMSDEVAVIRNPPMFYDRLLDIEMSKEIFTGTAYSDRQHTELVNGKAKRVQTADAWAKWSRRFSLEKIIYEPGKPRIYDGCLNAWKGLGVEPVKGSMAWWEEWMEKFLFRRAPSERKYFEQWLAYPLQHPGTKLFQASVLWSTEQGTGKSFPGEMMCGVYGNNASQLTKKDLTENFNYWAANKSFILGNEVTSNNRSARRADVDEMKNLITQEKVSVKKKYVPTYDIRDCINYYFTSQHADAFLLERSDRRFFVHEVTSGKIPRALYDKWKGLKLSGAGPSRLLAYLLEIDCSDFDPCGAPPLTAAKVAMINHGESNEERLVRELYEAATENDVWHMEHPCSGLNRHHIFLHEVAGDGARDIYTTKQLVHLYAASMGETTTPARCGMNPVALGRAFAAFNKAQPKDKRFPTHPPNPNREDGRLKIDGELVSLIAVRRWVKWLGSDDPEAWAENYRGLGKKGGAY